MDSFNSVYTTPPSVGLAEEYYKPQLRNDFEANYVQVREKSARGRNIFNLNWDSIPEAEFQAIKTFFSSHIGYAFTWTHPVTAVTHTVIFKEDTLRSEHVEAVGRRKTGTSLEEL
jgi:phage-related protein